MAPWLLVAALVVCGALAQSNCTGSAPLSNTVAITVVPGVLTVSASITLNTPACGAFTADVKLNGIDVFSAPVDVNNPTATCQPVSNVALVKSVCLTLSNLVVGATGASGTFGLTVETALGQASAPLLTFADNACIGECFNPCGGDGTCSSHGFCVSGTCRCIGAWSGARCEAPIAGNTAFTACVPFAIGAFSFRPCVSLAATPCNITWTLYADAQSPAVAGTIPLSSVPTTLTASSTFALVTITPVAGCTLDLSLTGLVYSAGTRVLNGNLTASALCPPFASLRQSVPFTNVAVASGVCALPCVHGVFDSTTFFACSCFNGWNGTLCNSYACPLACSGHGECSLSTGTCSCDALYSGSGCETNNRTAVAVGVTFGLLGLIALVALVVFLVLRRRSRQHAGTQLQEMTPSTSIDDSTPRAAEEAADDFF